MLTILDSIMRGLRDLPPPKLLEVSDFIHRLNPSTASMERKRAALRATAGCMAGADGEDFEQAVRETADHVEAGSGFDRPKRNASFP